MKKKKYLFLLFIPIYLIAFFVIESIINNDYNYWVSEIKLDAKIPFVPIFIIFYILWYPLLIFYGIYLFIKEENNFCRFMSFIIIGFTSSLLIYIIFPNGIDLRPDLSLYDSNIFIKMIDLIYSIDTHTNSLPSMHTIACIAIIISISKSDTLKDKKIIKYSIILLSILIILSTVFVKQHSLLDSFCSIVLCFPIYLFVYEKMKKHSTNRKLNILNLCLKLIMSILLIASVFFIILCEEEEQRSRLLFVSLQCMGLLLCLYAPGFLKKKTNFEIPPLMEFIFVLFCVAHFILGEIASCYIKYSWWDDMLHFLSGISLGIFGFILVNTFNNSKYINKGLNPIFVCIFSFGFALSCGVLWEIVEYISDGLTGSNMQRYMDDQTNQLLIGRDALRDTMKDFILDSLGALIASIFGYLDIRLEKHIISNLCLKNNKLEETLE